MKNKQFAFWTGNLKFFISNYSTYRKLKKNFSQEDFEEFGMKYAKYILQKLEVNLEIIGQENLVDGAFYVSNHGSMFDSYLTYIAIKNKHSYFIAGDLEFAMKIPLAKNFLKWANSIFVDRTSLKSGIKSIKLGEEQLIKGNNLVIFPEGEISSVLTDGQKLMSDFHPGSFKAAKTTKSLVVPMTIIGSEKIHNTNSLLSKISSADIKLIIHEAVADFTTNDNITTKEMAEKTHDIILNTLEEYNT